MDSHRKAAASETNLFQVVRRLCISRVENSCPQQEALLRVQIIYKPKEQDSDDASGLKTRKPEKLKPRKSKASCGGSHLQSHFLGDWGRRIARSLRTA